MPALFSPGSSLSRIGAMVMRHVYLMRSSVSRIVGLIYWPAVQVLTWGFFQLYIINSAGNAGTSRVALAAGTLIGAMLLWDILFRGQLGFSITLLEEIYSRNIGNLLMSPLRPAEFIVSLMVMSVLRLLVGLIPVSIMAFLFFGFNLWGLGLALAVFFANLIFTSWAVGLIVAGLVLRNGLGAEELAWSMMFLLMPLCCVYYPAAALPGWLQWIAWCLPPTYVFEGLRALLIDHVWRGDLMLQALAINAAFLAIGTAVFIILMTKARAAGSLLAMGE